jgi:hypothetical protein
MKALVSAIIGACVGYYCASVYAAIAVACVLCALYVVEHIKHTHAVQARSDVFRATVTYVQAQRGMPETAVYYGQDRRTTPTYQYK